MVSSLTWNKSQYHVIHIEKTFLKKLFTSEWNEDVLNGIFFTFRENFNKGLKKIIKSENIFTLIGSENSSEINADGNFQTYTEINNKNILQDYDFEKNYEKRKINSDQNTKPQEEDSILSKVVTFFICCYCCCPCYLSYLLFYPINLT